MNDFKHHASPLWFTFSTLGLTNAIVPCCANTLEIGSCSQKDVARSVTPDCWSPCRGGSRVFACTLGADEEATGSLSPQFESKKKLPSDLTKLALQKLLIW